MNFHTLALIAALLCSGCSAEQATAPTPSSGTVDPSLPAPLRNAQTALLRTLNAIQNGVDLRHIRTYEPDINFTEKSESFFETGVQLVRWDWSRRPEGNKHFVHLEFLLDEPPGNKTVSYYRAYTVSLTNGEYAIQKATK